MSQNWCKVSASLDSHPRIRRAGNLGRQVFEFALRRNAELDRNGVIPAEHMDAEYLADILMMTPEQAGDGVSRCVRTGLLALDSGHYVITGWDDEWGKRPLTEAERKRNQRAKSRKDEMSRKCPDTSVTESDCPECHGSEESREEERRSESALPPARAHAIPPSTEQAQAPAPVATPPQPTGKWHQRKAAWDFMLAADDRIRAHGIEPNAPKLPAAPAGETEKLLAACARELAASYGDDAVHEKLQHLVLVAEAEAKREGHRRWFKPSVIWEPKRAARVAATSLEEAATPLQPRERAGPRGSAARAPVHGRNPVLQNLLDDIARQEQREKATEA